MMLTNVRDTSLQAHDELKESGRIGTQEEEIYRLFFFHQKLELTRNEIAARMKMRLSAVCGRVNSLIEKEQLQDGERRACTISGKNCHVVKLRPRQLAMFQKDAP